jgi:preprotein translocase subunit SecF
MDLLRETNIDFMKYRKFWIWVSIALVIGGIFSAFFYEKLNFGIDFAGGTQLTLRFPDRPDVERLRHLVEREGVADAVIQRFGQEQDHAVLIKTPIVAGEEEGSGDKLINAIKKEFGDSVQVLARENVGPQVGSELRKKGLYAVLWSLAGMLVYIAFRFEVQYGVGAIMATIHDVLVTVGLFTAFGFEWNLTTIAAFLTLIGYSVNDTVVTFDRVRENLRKTRTEPLISVLNKSINQTLSRTILTGGTVLLASGALLVLGGDVLRGIAFVLFVGVIIGTYSSIYVASPFALLWAQRFGKEAQRLKSGAAQQLKPQQPAPKAKRAAGSRR